MPPAKPLPAREIVAICPPGLEDTLSRELSGLGWPKPRAGTGLVSCTGDARQIYAACLGSRCATDLRVRVGRGPAGSLEGLAQGLAKLPWSLFVHPGQAVEVSVHSQGSRLKRRDVAARKAQLAIRDAVRGPRYDHRPGQRSPRSMEPVKVFLRVESDRVEASVDPVGTPLWQRGYRSRGGAAPLRENLAAAAVLAMGWDARRPLLDPFCGSGTILIEAAGIAAARLPGSDRRFAFESWPCHLPRVWRSTRANLQPPGPGRRAVILGSDADSAVLEIARGNARAAKLGELVRWSHARVDALQAPDGGPGLVLGNPPWGQRLGERVRGVYSALGAVLRERFGGWELGLLCPDRALIKAVGIHMEPRLQFPHGGARLTLWAGRVPTTAMRDA